MSADLLADQAGGSGAQPDVASFPAAARNLPPGYSEGSFAGKRWGVTADKAEDGRCWWL